MRKVMRKVMQAGIIAGSSMLCLCLFLLGNAVAGEGSNGVELATDSSTQNKNMCGEKSTVAMNEDYVVLVAGEESPEDGAAEPKSEKKKHKKGDPANCVLRAGAGATASNGSACTGGTACMFSGTQMCTYGTCWTYNPGNGICQCKCQGSRP
jgi:hypothetical protein